MWSGDPYLFLIMQIRNPQNTKEKKKTDKNLFGQ